MRCKIKWLALGAAAAVLSLGSVASATVLNFTTVFPNSGTINDALFETNDQQPTGSGVIHSFVRISAANQGEVEGYNTDGRPLQYDENNSPTFTRRLNVDWLQSVTIGSDSYYQFLLDINQLNSGAPERYLSLTEMQIFLGNSDSLTNSTSDGNGGITFAPADAYKVFDLDDAPAGDSRIDLNYDFNSGSGSGDMYAFIPTSVFTGPNKWIYLYSKFGTDGQVNPPYPNNDGYEEWAAVIGPNVVVPIPAAVWGGMALCGFVGASKLRRRQQVD